MQQPGRMRMRLWLEEQIESGKYPGVSWLDKSARIFQIPWKHAARQGWSIDRDATLFRSWAVHTGRYRPGKNKPDPKTWKANFRCALNSLPDVCELPEYSKKRGSNAYRVYKMLPSTQTHRRRRGLRLVSRSREPQAGSCSPAGSGSVHTWQQRTPFSDNVETKAEDVMFNTHTGMWEARTEPEDPEQNEAIFKLMDQLSSADVWNQAGGQRGWRTYPLWDHCHCPADGSLCSLQTDDNNELFTPNYMKDVSDWSAYQLMS